jgi:hypothetical protein
MRTTDARRTNRASKVKSAWPMARGRLFSEEKIAKLPTSIGQRQRHAALVAQLVEQRTLNPWVLGSSPSGGTEPKTFVNRRFWLFF